MIVKYKYQIDHISKSEYCDTPLIIGYSRVEPR